MKRKLTPEGEELHYVLATVAASFAEIFAARVAEKNEQLVERLIGAMAQRTAAGMPVSVGPSDMDRACKTQKEIRALQPGLSEHVLRGIKRASAGQPDSPWSGRFTTPRRIMAWLAAHPDFVASHHRVRNAR